MNAFQKPTKNIVDKAAAIFPTLSESKSFNFVTVNWNKNVGKAMLPPSIYTHICHIFKALTALTISKVSCLKMHRNAKTRTCKW